MTTTAPTAHFRPGTHVTGEHEVHSTPLGYDRATLPAGALLPLPASDALVEGVSHATTVELAFHGKLGDSLLALSAARAALDWLAQRMDAVPVNVRASGPHADLVRRTSLLAQAVPSTAPEGSRLLIGDRAGIAARGAEAATSLVCDPAAPPCWSADGIAHTSLPNRYYLALERRLGVRLPTDPPFTPQLVARPNWLVRRLRATGWFEGITLAAITATSRPDLKDYTAQRYIEVAQLLAQILNAQVRLLLIGGHHASGSRITAADANAQLQSLRLDGLPVNDLADLLPHCSLVIGNDTGLTHLAALSRGETGEGPHVIGLHARHSHSKWNTGLPHHHAVSTVFAHQMHQGDLCPVRDALTPTDDDCHLDAVAPAWLASICAELLLGGVR
ncbi:glycosyltransferase family 9 protein [Streptomyces sp. NBC_01803]|uniref:glycosyltransferase family 9 protein n=1 Tax=Streptomyces sp. NBC_01803 TaxID=2975946 RepID=UPI002DDB65FC|nr:glycosyltransferase family 9 protein [Streptomyces sp. NBC_01803]WSA45128.1 lipopolysaccharide heptosyltransferase family protein [Streptomyces sp. NBC_01803]